MLSVSLYVDTLRCLPVIQIVYGAERMVGSMGEVQRERECVWEERGLRVEKGVATSVSNGNKERPNDTMTDIKTRHLACSFSL